MEVGRSVKTSELAKGWGVLGASLTPFWAFEAFGLASRPLSVGHFRGTWFPRPLLGLRKVYGSHHSSRVQYCGRAERVGDAAAYPLETAADLFWAVLVSEDRRFP